MTNGNETDISAGVQQGLLAAQAAPEEVAPAISLGKNILQVQAAGAELKNQGATDEDAIRQIIQSTRASGNTQLQEGLALLDKVNTNQPLSKGELLAMLATQLLTVGAGAALGGKSGAFAGLKAGGEGGAAALKLRGEQAKAGAVKDKLRAEVKIDDARAQEKFARELEKELRESSREVEGEERRSQLSIDERQELADRGILFAPPSKGDTITVLPEGFSKAEEDAVTAPLVIQDGIDYVDQTFGKDFKEGQSGTLLRKIKELGSDTVAREFKSVLTGLVNNSAAATMVGTLSEGDIDRAFIEATGGKFAAVQLIRKRLVAGLKRALRAGKITANRINKARKEEILNPAIFDSVAALRESQGIKAVEPSSGISIDELKKSIATGLSTSGG